MSYKILFDANDSKQIHVVGLGDYVPVAEAQALAAQVEALKLIVVVHERELPNLLNKSNEDKFYLPLSVAMNTIVDAMELRQKEITKIRAEAVESALDAVGVPCTKFKNHSADFTAGFNFCGAQVQLYAEQIRKGEVK